MFDENFKLEFMNSLSSMYMEDVPDIKDIFSFEKNELAIELLKIGDPVVVLDCNHRLRADFSKYRDDLNYIIHNYPEIPIIITGYDNTELLGDYVDYKNALQMIEASDSVSKKSTCTRLKVGCVISDFKNEEIFSTGYNHVMTFGTEIPQCSQKFSIIDRTKENFKELHRQFSEKYEIHAEVWALSSLSKDHTKNQNNELMNIYTSISPCVNCAKSIIADARIKIAFYRQEYDRTTEGLDVLNDFGILTIHL